MSTHTIRDAIAPALFFCVFFLWLAPAPAPAASPTPGDDNRPFAFSLPNDAWPEEIADLAFLNPTPANEFVTVRDGHFYAGNQRIRFYGVCVIGAAAFPPREQAPIIARRLAARGMNQVRIHLIDGHAAPLGIFDPEHKSELRILPAQLDLLDFFIAELKKNGIYVELPIHGYHWRNMVGPAEYPNDDLKSLPPFSSGVPLWTDRFIQAEQRFAREFFGHVNPYIHNSYIADPCVSTVEIINENGILCAWRGGHVRKTWPQGLRNDLASAWNAFLRKRYPDTDTLRRAWAEGETHPDKTNLVTNASFDAKTIAPWFLQQVQPSTATIAITPNAAPDSTPAVTITTDRSPEPKALVIFQQGRLPLEQNCRYSLSFLARADLPDRETIKTGVSVTMDHAPWLSLGLSSQHELGNSWRKITLDFRATQSGQAKILFVPPQGQSRISLAQVSLCKTQVVGLPDQERLEQGTVSLPLAPEDCTARTRSVASDLVDFLYSIDSAYFESMRRFLKNDLACKHPVKGTQVDQYSSYFSQGHFDYFDSHGYWEHPSFPHRPWDPQDWTVGNSPMINHHAAVPVELAQRRVRGYPFNISEYCHPAPSTYCAEQIPTITALGAFQDWDGIVFHCWQELEYDWPHREVRSVPADKIDSWFNIARHPVKLVTLPFGALAFRRADIAPGRTETSIGVSLDEEKRWFIERTAHSWHSFNVAAEKGASWLDAFTHRLDLDLHSTNTPNLLPPTLTRAHSDTGELDYDATNQDASALVVNAPRAKAIIGFGTGKTFTLDDVILTPGQTIQAGFSVITASVVHGQDFHSPGTRILVTATGHVENQGMIWNETHTSVGKNWGTGPVVCEGVPLRCVLRTKRPAHAWALDPHGHRTTQAPAEPNPDGTAFSLGPSYRTLWYEIAID